MHLLSSHSESCVTAYLSKDPCHRCSGSALTSHKSILPTDVSLNYFMFLPFFLTTWFSQFFPDSGTHEVNTILWSILHSRIHCGDLNLIPLGSVRAGEQQEQTFTYLVRKEYFVLKEFCTLDHLPYSP